ncbi:MAG: hypothetical protein CMG27_03700, partial [Candidatus Marinimicrobia bacterium]|nr:hypothetical protein [Candidatus Neomarinimicrobiota bacterium]
MIRSSISRNLRFWAVVACLLAGDCLVGWIAFKVTIHPSLLSVGFSSEKGLLVFLLVQSAVVLLLLLNGRYRVDPTISRFVEVQTVFKVTLLLAIIVVLLKEFGGVPIKVESGEVLRYWIVLALLISTNRVVIRQIQKILLHRGIGQKNTIVVGVNTRARKMARELEDIHLGYNVVGFVTPGGIDAKLSSIDDLPILS